MKKKKVLALLAVVTLLSATGCGKELTLVAEQVEMELGSELDTTATNYVADEALAEDTVLDFSAVNTLKAGTYPVTATYKEQTATFNVVVTDTVAPEVEVAEDIVVEAGTPLTAQDVIAGVTELSGVVEVTIVEPEAVTDEDAVEMVEDTEVAEDTETVEATEAVEGTVIALEPFTVDDVMCSNDYVVFAETGEYDVIISVADMSGNSAEALAHIVVGEAPTISGVEDMTVTVGTEEVDYLDGVTATDCNGNDITDKIVCDADNVDLENAGQYGITYTVVDENGFEKSVSAIMTVKEKNGGRTGTASRTESKPSSTNTTSSGTSSTTATSTNTTNTTTGSQTSTQTQSTNSATSDTSNQTSTSASSSSTTTTTTTPSADTSTQTPSTDASASSGTTTTTPSTDTTTTTNPWDVPMTEPESGFGTGEIDSSLLDNTGTGGVDGGDVIGGGN